LWAWQEFAPETLIVFGHKSKPASHHFYRSDAPLKSIRYLDPAARKDERACLLELRSFASDGTVGLQTVVPPSTHSETGEPIEFVGIKGDPGKVDAIELKHSTDRKAHCKALRMPMIASKFSTLAEQAIREKQSHLGYLEALLLAEIEERERNTVERRIREAHLPRMKTLEHILCG
jgi:hypothetical protein